MKPHVLALAGVLGCACASQSPSYQKQLSELQDKVLILQNEGDRFQERLEAVELQLEAGSAAVRHESLRQNTRPPLPTIRVTPPDGPPRPPAVAPPATPSVVAISGSGQDVTTRVVLSPQSSVATPAVSAAAVSVPPTPQPAAEKGAPSAAPPEGKTK